MPRFWSPENANPNHFEVFKVAASGDAEAGYRVARSFLALGLLCYPSSSSVFHRNLTRGKRGDDFVVCLALPHQNTKVIKSPSLSRSSLNLF